MSNPWLIAYIGRCGVDLEPERGVIASASPRSCGQTTHVPTGAAMAATPSMTNSPPASTPIPAKSWVILALAFSTGLLNYIDRQTLAILKTTLKTTLHLTDTNYSHLVIAFMLPYIVFYVISGRLVDRWGTRLGMTLFVGTWSLANLVCAFATNVMQLSGANAVLGCAEPGYFPANLRVVMKWFPHDRRAFALGLISPCSTVAALITPALIAWLTRTWSWHLAFAVPGAVGTAVALAWWTLDRAPELPVAAPAPALASPALPLAELLRDRRVWGLVGTRILTDSVFYFQLFWLPGYMQERLGLSLKELGAVAWIPSLVATLCIIAAGRWSDAQVAAGREVVQTRMKLFTFSAMIAPLGALTTIAPNLWVAFLIITLVTIVSQMWFFSYGVIISELFPGSAASVVGLLGACGASGGLLMNLISGPLIEHVGYAPVFITLAFMHPIGAIILSRTLQPSRR